MAAGLLTSLALTFGPGLVNWYLNRDMAETQEGALKAQELLAALQGQLMQNRAQVEEPFRASLLNSIGGLVDRPQTALAPGRMSVVNPFLNLNRAQRSPTGEYSFEQALPGAKRQFIGPESFEQVQAPGMNFQEGVLESLAAQSETVIPDDVDPNDTDGDGIPNVEDNDTMPGGGGFTVGENEKRFKERQAQAAAEAAERARLEEERKKAGGSGSKKPDQPGIT